MNKIKYIDLYSLELLSFPAKEIEHQKDDLPVNEGQRSSDQGTGLRTSPTHSAPKKRRVDNGYVPKQGFFSSNTLLHSPTRSKKPLLNSQVSLDQEETGNTSTDVLMSRMREVHVYPQLSLHKPHFFPP